MVLLRGRSWRLRNPALDDGFKYLYIIPVFRVVSSEVEAHITKNKKERLVSTSHYIGKINIPYHVYHLTPTTVSQTAHKDNYAISNTASETVKAMVPLHHNRPTYARRITEHLSPRHRSDILAVSGVRSTITPPSPLGQSDALLCWAPDVRTATGST